MKNSFCIGVLTLALFSCSTGRTLESAQVPPQDRVSTLGRFITLKSPVLEAVFSLYDVNLERDSIPGPSDKDYRIILKVPQGQAKVWTHGYENALTSFPQGLSWAKELVSPKEYEDLLQTSFEQYALEKPGLNYTLFISNEKSLVLIHYREF